VTYRFVAALLASVVHLSACIAWHSQPLPAAASREAPGTGRLRAGIAEVDMTPQPGGGLGGNGLEGRRSTGYRTRLHVGALVLEDPTGERLALVVADMAHVSANIHRLAAARLVETTGIGADRLILSATHTHSGPANFYGERQYNVNASRVPGYDAAMVDFLVTRIVEAVQRATAELAPAELAWGDTSVAGVTRNRSPEAFCRNPEGEPFCENGTMRDTAGAVDRRLVLLRVDQLTRSGRRPLGSYALFAMHGNTIPSLTTVFDGDVQSRVAKRLAQEADPLGRRTVHLLANAAGGDASPAVERDRCDLPYLGLAEPVPMPRGPGESVDFLVPPRRDLHGCLVDALGDAESIALRVSYAAIALYRRLEPQLRPDVEIRRAFATVWLPGRDSLCAGPEIGAAAGAGAELQEMRVRGWRWLVPGIRLGLEEGGLAVRRGEQCQSPKLPLLAPFQSTFIVGEHGLPRVAQLTVARIGSMLLAAVPVELTTVAGQRIRRELETAAQEAGLGTTDAALAGLANGYLLYVTTAEEYEAQHYEGASNLYGPGAAGFLGRRLVELVRQLPPAGGGASPPVEVGPIVVYPGSSTSLWPHASDARVSPSGPISLHCEDGVLVADWLDQPPASILARKAPWVAVEREASGRWTRVAEDGDGRLELHALGTRKGKGFAWRAIWRESPDAARLRFVRVADALSSERVSRPVGCPVAPVGKP
jgi:neutral ceramidase